MQLIVTLSEGGAVEIKCPGCDSLLETVKEQAKGDQRVHIMLHPEANCKWSKQKFRVDRIWGYAEPWPGVSEQEALVLCAPTEDETRTSTTTSEPSPLTTSTKPTQLTRRVIPGGGLGRIRR